MELTYVYIWAVVIFVLIIVDSYRLSTHKTLQELDMVYSVNSKSGNKGQDILARINLADPSKNYGFSH